MGLPPCVKRQSKPIARSPSSRTAQHACTKYGKHFARKGTLSNHMQLHTGHYCKQCRKGYSGLAPFQVHMNKHEGIKYQCEYCPKTFTETQARDYHHSSPTEYRLSCDMCGKGFNNKRGYEQHAETHD